MSEYGQWHQEMVLVFRPDWQAPSPHLDAVLTELVGLLSTTPFPRFRDYVMSGTIRAELGGEGSTSTLVQEVREGRLESGSESERYISVLAEVSIDSSLIAGPDAPGYVWEVTRNSILCRLADSIGLILLAGAIAKPGAFTVVHAAAPTRVGLRAFPRLCLSVPKECRELSEKCAWPPLSMLAVRAVHEWLQSSSGADVGLGEGHVGRAIAALSYCASHDHQNEARLIWPLVGLEALFGRNKEGLQRQLLDKSEALLGPRTAFIKKFRGIYEARSKFLHGEVDMPFACSHASWDLKDFGTGVEEATYLAIAILIATLQHLATENRHDLEFGYQRLEPPKPAPGPTTR